MASKRIYFPKMVQNSFELRKKAFNLIIGIFIVLKSIFEKIMDVYLIFLSLKLNFPKCFFSRICMIFFHFIRKIVGEGQPEKSIQKKNKLFYPNKYFSRIFYRRFFRIFFIRVRNLRVPCVWKKIRKIHIFLFSLDFLLSLMISEIL